MAILMSENILVYIMFKNDDKVKIADNNRIKKPSERVKQFSEDLEISSDGPELLYFCTRCNFYDWNGGYDIATC